MGKLAIRGVVGVAGALGLFLAVRLWVAPAVVGANLGLIGEGPLGQATLRADVGGFFAAVGVFAIAGAARGEARLLTAPLLMVATAIAARLVAAAVNGLDQRAVQAIVVEAVLVAVFGLGRWRLGR